MQLKRSALELETVELVPVGAGPGASAIERKNPFLHFVAAWRWFLIFVGAPTVFAAVYLFAIAADRYEAESKFIVRNPSLGTSSLSGLMQEVGGAGMTNDAYIVHAYMRSRDALKVLVSQAGLLERLNRPEADFLWRYPSFLFKQSQEHLWKHFNRFLTIDYDQTTGISTLRVQAFRPDDAKIITEVLLGSAETLVNHISARAQGDAVATAAQTVEDSRLNAQDAVNKITEFRKKNRMIDPGKISASALDTITQLSLDIAKTKAELAELTSSSPDSPQATSLQRRIAAINDQIAQERRLLAGSDQSLAPLIAEYEMLTLNREFSERTFASAQSALELARIEASRQQIFLENISSPTAPDYPIYPRRLLQLIGVFALCSLAYAIGRKLVLEVLAHAER